MDLEQIKQILDLVREHELSEFEIEHDGLRLKIRKDSNGAHLVSLPSPVVPAVVMPAAGGVLASPAPVAASGGPAAPTDAGADSEIELAVVKSPIVGTFYRSPEAGAASFVDVGSTVKKGQVLCIIEAMKLMNEIESDVDGVIAEIYPQNAQAVEFGEPLFAIRLA
jgi:acetyl-CoA carboxylase biotin carboxyl carrier protein